MALIEKSFRKGGCVLWTRGPYKQLSVVNTIHIQMRVTKFGTETSTRPPPGLPSALQRKGAPPFVNLTRV